jgi:hypothetical protein
MLTKELLLQKRDLESAEVEIPGLGTARVRAMTAAERDRFEFLATAGEKTGRRSFRALLACFTLCDDAGKRILEEKDLTALGELPATTLEPITDAALKLNRISSGDVDEMEKNSEAIPSGSSSSGSP